MPCTTAVFWQYIEYKHIACMSAISIHTHTHLSKSIHHTTNSSQQKGNITKQVTVYWWNFFSPGDVLLSPKTYFTKISVLYPFLFFPIYFLVTSSVIPATICLLVFYSHVNAISSLYSRDLIVQNLIHVY